MAIADTSLRFDRIPAALRGPVVRPARTRGAALAGAVLAAVLAGETARPQPSAGPSGVPARQLQWEVVASYPPRSERLPPGLMWHDGGFFESTGLLGRSTLRRVEWPSGRVVRRVDLPRDGFGEGLAAWGAFVAGAPLLSCVGRPPCPRARAPVSGGGRDAGR